MKGKWSVYDKCLPTIGLEKLKKQFDKDELICKAAVEHAAESLQKAKDDHMKFIKKWQEEFENFNLKLNRKVYGPGVLARGEVVEWQG